MGVAETHVVDTAVSDGVETVGGKGIGAKETVGWNVRKIREMQECKSGVFMSLALPLQKTLPRATFSHFCLLTLRLQPTHIQGGRAVLHASQLEAVGGLMRVHVSQRLLT